MDVRRYEPPDRGHLLGLASCLAEGVAAWRDPGAVQRAVLGWVRESLAAHERGDRGEVQVFVATRAGEVIGFVTVAQRRHWTGEVEAYLGELAVRDDARRQGVARQLVATAEGCAAARGYGRISVETGASNAAARGLYAALGYVEEDVTFTKPLIVASQRSG